MNRRIALALLPRGSADGAKAIRDPSKAGRDWSLSRSTQLDSERNAAAASVPEYQLLSDLWIEDTDGSFKNRTWQVLLGVTFGL